jgi:putative transposase
VKINGQPRYQKRAVDQEGEVLDAVVTTKRDRKAALKLLRKLMRRYGKPEFIVTDKLKSYGAALREIGIDPSLHEIDSRWINNQAENSHLPVRRFERMAATSGRLAVGCVMQPGTGSSSSDTTLWIARATL